jgi:flagellar motility protein MotE (MotC chaperone)
MKFQWIYTTFLMSCLVAVGLCSSTFAQEGRSLNQGTSSLADYNLKMEHKAKIRQYKQFNQKKDRFHALQNEFDRKKKRLRNLELEVVRRYKALRSIQDELAYIIRQQEEEQAEQEDTVDDEGAGESRGQEIRRLAKTYEAMKANQAASVIEVLVADNKLQLAVDVIKVIKPRKSGKILGALKPEIAARVSERMSGKRKRKSRKK